MNYNYGAFERTPPQHRLPNHPQSNLYYAHQPVPVSVDRHSHEYFRSQMEMREEIRRQIEKDRIREEIIARENARRRLIEAEVRYELMMERENAMRRGDALRPLPEEQRIVRLLEERLGVLPSGAGRGDNSRSRQIVPFREPSLNEWTSRGVELKPPSEQNFKEPNVLELEPASSELDYAKERIVFQAKPDANVSGVKRKAEEPEAAIGGVNIPKKKVREEWSCAICQVSATSEEGLKEHLRGKKHKSKEAALKMSKNGNIGLLPKKTKPDKHVESTDCTMPKETSKKQCPKSKDAAPSIQTDHIADKPKEKKNAVSGKKKRKHKVVKRKKFPFWCEHCEVGAFSEKVMEDHEKGKKHLSLLNKTKCEGTKKVDDNSEAIEKNHKVTALSEKVIEGCKSEVDVNENPDENKY